MTAQTLSWSLFVLCLIVSFFLSGMEAGVFALSRLRVRQQMRGGRRSARVLQGFLENPENFLWTIVVGNTLANLLIFGWLFMVALPFFDTASIAAGRGSHPDLSRFACPGRGANRRDPAVAFTIKEWFPGAHGRTSPDGSAQSRSSPGWKKAAFPNSPRGPSGVNTRRATKSGCR